VSLRPVREDILSIPADPAVLGHFSDVRPLAGPAGRLDWILNAALSRAWRRRSDLFEFGRLTLLATGGRFPFPRVIVVGLGARERFGREERREAYRLALGSALSLGGTRVSLEAFGRPGVEPAGAADDLEGALSSLPRRPVDVTLALEGGGSGRRSP
jgi:leucyl aminopeptidase